MSGKRVRCAIYTRKSSDEGLEQKFNSLDAQRESCEAYIKSMQGEGWECLPDRYDDGGISGGTMDRPALQGLLADIAAGKIDCLVIYRYDRLSRSMMDFFKLLEVFEQRKVAFVSITEQFNTASPTGRLMFNMILTFAQFERELASERTRHKIEATRRKGLWSGGRPVLGYDIERQVGGNRLVVNKAEAKRVNDIYRLYLEKGSISLLIRALRDKGWTNKAWTGTEGQSLGGGTFNKSQLHRLLTNPTYLGKVVHKDDVFEGVHDAIVDQTLFDRVQAGLKSARCVEHSKSRNMHGALLKGVMRCGACDCAMVHHFSARRTKTSKTVYRYYVCSKAQKLGFDTCPGATLPAVDVETFAVEQIKSCGRELGLLTHSVRKAQDLLREQIEDLAKQAEAAECTDRERASLDARRTALEERLLDEDEIAGAIEAFDPVWDALESRERERLVGALIERVVYDAHEQTLTVVFREEAACPA